MFVVQLYLGQTNHLEMSLPEARWFLYTKLNDSYKLPPTANALKYKILRSHLTCLTWKSSHLKNTIYPNPSQYGWEKIEETFVPIMRDKLSAPEAVVEMCMCNCKTGCSNFRCKCRKNELVCTEMCNCS